MFKKKKKIVHLTRRQRGSCGPVSFLATQWDAFIAQKHAQFNERRSQGQNGGGKVCETSGVGAAQ